MAKRLFTTSSIVAIRGHTKEEGSLLAVRKIAITVPPTTLQRIDGWAEKLKISRSQFIVDQVEKQLEDLEDEDQALRLVPSLGLALRRN